MTTISAADKLKLRSGHPHAVRVFMSILRPTVLYRGLVDGLQTRGSREVVVENVSGDLSNVVAGNTIWVGTSTGTYNVSRRRFRSFTGSTSIGGTATIKLDENGVVWADQQHITIVQDWEVWPVFPFIEKESPYTFFKDRDIAYSDQNSQPTPIAILKTDRIAGFLSGGSLVFNINATTSYAIADGATISSYLWQCSDGTIASATSATTTITFTTTHKDGIWLWLTVTDSNGKSKTIRKPLFIHDTLTNAPYKDFTIDQPISRVWKEGASRVGFTLFGDVSLDDVPDRTLVVVWYTSYYNGEEYYIGDHGNSLFVGRIRSESTRRDYGAGTVSMQATSESELLKIKTSFSISLVDKTSPTTWYEYKTLTLSRAVHHVYEHHSTLTSVINLYLPSIASYRLVACDDFVNGDLHSVVESFASEHGVFAHMCANAVGDLRLEIDMNMLSDSERASKPIVMAIEDVDRLSEGDGDITVIRKLEKLVSYVFVSGTTYDGTESTPLISKAPGEVPEAEGPSFSNFENLVLTGQTDSNSKAGRVLAIANNYLEPLAIRFVGNYSFFDVSPQEFYQISVFAEETKREIDWVDVKIIPRSVTLTFDPATGLLDTDVIFDVEAVGDVGIPGDFPSGYPAPEEPPPAQNTLANLVAFNNSAGTYLRGSWIERNGALTGAGKQDQHGNIDPYWYVKQGTDDPAFLILIKCVPGAIYRTIDAGLNWTAITPNTNPPNTAGDDPAPTASGVTYMYMDSNFFVSGEHLVMARWSPDGNVWRTWLLYTDDDFTTHSWTFLGSAGGGTGLGDERVFWAVDMNTTKVPPEKTVCRMTDTTFGMVTNGAGAQRVGYGCVDPDDGLTYVTEGGGVIVPTVSAIAVCRLTDTRMMIVIVANAVPCGGGGATNHMRLMPRNVIDNCPTPDIDVESNVCATGYQGMSSVPTSISIVALGDEERFLVAVNKQNNGSAGASCMVVSYDGISYSYGSPLTLTTNATLSVSAIAKEGDDVVEVYYVEGGDAKVARVTISSLTASLSNTYTVQSGVDLVSAAFVDSTYTVVSFKDTSDTFGYVMSAIVGAGGITTGSPLLVKSSAVDSCMISAFGTSAFVAYDVAGVLTVIPISVNGLDVDASSEIDLASDGGYLGIAALNTGGFVVSYFDSDSSNWASVAVYDGASANNKGTGLSIGRGGGSLLYATYCNGGQLVLAVYTLPDMTLIDEYSLGPATTSQLDALQKIVWPITKIGYTDNTCYLFGNMTSGLGIVQILKTTTAGVSYSVIENSWGGNICAALDVDRTGNLVAARDYGSGSKMYFGQDVLQFAADVPLRLNPGGLFVTVDGYAVVGHKLAGGAFRFMYAPRPYTIWADVTEDYPSTGGVTKLGGV